MAPAELNGLRLVAETFIADNIMFSEKTRWMLRALIVGALLLSGHVQVWADDAVKTDPDKYKVVLENERVRVLEYRDKPGQKTDMHTHPDFVLQAMAPFKRKLTLSNGKTMTREFKAGEIVWMNAQSHIGENIGDTDTHVLITELKEIASKKTVETDVPNRIK
jgi:quercetin dioxygenase-like cupin family protein